MAEMPLDEMPLLQLTLTPTSGSSLAIALTIAPVAHSVVPADALTLQVVAAGPSSVAIVYGGSPSMPRRPSKAPPVADAPGRMSFFEGFMTLLGFQSCFHEKA